MIRSRLIKRFRTRDKPADAHRAQVRRAMSRFEPCQISRCPPGGDPAGVATSALLPRRALTR